MSEEIIKRLRHTEKETATIGQDLVYLQVPVNPDGPEAADEIELLRKQLAHSVDLGNSFMDKIEQLTEELDRYKYATGVLLTAFNSKWQSRTPAEVLRAALEDQQ
jgi:hypothetical protein